MLNTNIFFCGLTKNCIDTIGSNLDFILNFKNSSNFKNVYFISVDSDSIDGTKNLLEDFSKNNSFAKHINADNLSEIYSSRIERIAHCRNICLDTISLDSESETLLYIPLDLDIDLFKFTDISKFENQLIDFIEQKTYDAIFPVSTPYYYDIFALRAEGWLNVNSQLIINRVKKYLFVGSFILNYFFIFKKQLSLSSLKTKKIKVSSAFGGAGIYKLDSKEAESIRYTFSNSNRNLISEHIFFNSYFENLFINTDWIIPAPEEHIGFKTLSLRNKIIYFFKTIKFDLKSDLT